MERPTPRAPWRPLRVALALGGGAARGLAHLGVLRVLERERIPIDLIVGTSMGAIIGGAYAAGGGAGQLEARFREMFGTEEFLRTRRSFLIESKKRRGGLLYSVANLVRKGVAFGKATVGRFESAERFARSLSTVVPDEAIEQLPLPFAAVALDMDRAEEVVITGGSLRRAALASSAIPGLLPPMEWRGRQLIDGGWIDKVPVLPAFTLGADVVLAVDITADLDNPQHQEHGMDAMLRANAIRDTRLISLVLRMADVALEPAVGHVHWADFAAFDECLAAGDRAATAALPAIRDLLQRERWASLLRPGRARRAAWHALRGEGIALVVER